MCRAITVRLYRCRRRCSVNQSVLILVIRQRQRSSPLFLCGFRRNQDEFLMPPSLVSGLLNNGRQIAAVENWTENHIVWQLQLHKVDSLGFSRAQWRRGAAQMSRPHDAVEFERSPKEWLAIFIPVKFAVSDMSCAFDRYVVGEETIRFIQLTVKVCPRGPCEPQTRTGWPRCRFSAIRRTKLRNVIIPALCQCSRKTKRADLCDRVVNNCNPCFRLLPA